MAYMPHDQKSLIMFIIFSIGPRHATHMTVLAAPGRRYNYITWFLLVAPLYLSFLTINLAKAGRVCTFQCARSVLVVSNNLTILCSMTRKVDILSTQKVCQTPGVQLKIKFVGKNVCLVLYFLLN